MSSISSSGLHRAEAALHAAAQPDRAGRLLMSAVSHDHRDADAGNGADSSESGVSEAAAIAANLLPAMLSDCRSMHAPQDHSKTQTPGTRDQVTITESIGVL